MSEQQKNGAFVQEGVGEDSRRMFPEGTPHSTEIRERICLSQDVPTPQQGWADPDFVPRRTFSQRLQRWTRRVSERLKHFGMLEVVVILLVLGGVVYFLSLDSKTDVKRRGSSLLR